jgi:predicted dinucleotide-binding enzyme
VLITGDDEEAKRKVSELVSDGSLRPLDVGPLSLRIRHLARSGC